MATYVRVKTSGETYALPVHQVQEVGDLGALTLVPGAKPSALGVCNLRGEILAVYDLAAVLGISDAQRRRRLVVVDLNEYRLGLTVDEVAAVGDLQGPEDTTTSNLLIGSTVIDEVTVGFLNLFVMIEVLRVEASR